MNNLTFVVYLITAATILTKPVVAGDKPQKIIAQHNDDQSGVQLTVALEGHLTIEHATLSITVENKATKSSMLTENNQTPIYPLSVTRQDGSKCAYVRGGLQEYKMGLFISATHTIVMKAGEKRTWKLPLEDFVEVSPGVLHVKMGAGASFEQPPRTHIDLSPPEFDVTIDSK